MTPTLSGFTFLFFYLHLLISRKACKSHTNILPSSSLEPLSTLCKVFLFSSILLLQPSDRSGTKLMFCASRWDKKNRDLKLSCGQLEKVEFSSHWKIVRPLWPPRNSSIDLVKCCFRFVLVQSSTKWFFLRQVETWSFQLGHRSYFYFHHAPVGLSYKIMKTVIATLWS